MGSRLLYCRACRTTASVLAISSGAAHATHDPAWPPAPVPVAGDTPSGVLRFEILDDQGHPMSGRLTFVAHDGSRPQIFPNTQADPDDLAVRRNVIYTLSGRGAVTVPVGTYTVWVSKGLEYGIDSRTLTFAQGAEAIWTPSLDREVDTTGWVSGDFHLHTLTHSGHGDSNMPERVISLIGEGVEFAVATDHNHNTDYEPTMRDLGVPDAMRAVTGNEVSTPIGHFNAFPLDPSDPVMESEIYSGHELFKLIREQGNPFGTIPVVQVNHPRWGGIDYFGQFDVSPVTGASDMEGFSYDFDSVEIFNENEGWGYIDADERDIPTGSNSFSVLRDWFNLLNRGHRIAAVGNSDSHNVESELAGWPRNFIASTTDTPAEIDPAEVAANIRAKRVYTTLGPIVDFSANGAPMGGACTAHRQDQSETDAGWVDVSIMVQAPSWIACDRVMIVVNGDTVRTIEVPKSTRRVRLETTERIRVRGDSWVSLLVEGDTPLAPIVHSQGRPIYPWAVINPVWVDADGDGQWVSPVEQAGRLVRSTRPSEVLTSLSGASDSRWVNTIIAACDQGGAGEALIRQGLAHESRQVKLAALGALEQRLAKMRELNEGQFAQQRDAWIRTLRDVLAMSGKDQHLRVRAMLALSAAGDEQVRTLALGMLTGENGASKLRDGFEPQLIKLLGGAPVNRWTVAGYFQAPEFGTLAQGFTPAETSPDEASFQGGKSEGEVVWRSIKANVQGYVDLRSLTGDREDANNAIVTARVWFISDGSEIGYAFGADDASRVILNGETIYEEHTDHSANPMQQVGRMKPRQGLNQLLVSVENGSGGYGFYFRVFDDQVAESMFAVEPSAKLSGDHR